MNKEVSLDIQEVNLDNINLGTKEISINNDELNNSDFGSGIELLMNEKVKNNTKSPSNNISSLESDLNNIELNTSSNSKDIKIEELNMDSKTSILKKLQNKQHHMQMKHGMDFKNKF